MVMPFLRTRFRPAHSSKSRRRGFTLIEASLTIVIVGVGVLAAAQLLAIGSEANAHSHRLTTALHLAGNVRELAQQKTGAELLAMHGQSYQPARDARGEPIVGLEDWVQVISVERMTPSNITVTAGASSTSRLLRLTVTVRYRGSEVTSEAWLLADTSE